MAKKNDADQEVSGAAEQNSETTETKRAMRTIALESEVKNGKSVVTKSVYIPEKPEKLGDFPVEAIHAKKDLGKGKVRVITVDGQKYDVAA